MQKLLTDLHAQFVENLREAGKASATILAYGKDVEQMNEFLAKRSKSYPEQVEFDNIEEFKKLLKKQRYTAKSISRKLNSIKAFFKFLKSQGILRKNPALLVTHPRYKQGLPRILSRLEYRALRDACKHDVRMSAVVEVLLQTGMRISELAALTIDDIDFERNVISIQPQNSFPARKVPLNMAAKKTLLDYLEVRPKSKEKTLFLTKTCRPFLVRNIRTSIDRYFRLAGIRDAKVNDLRHTFIVEQLKAGTPLVYVSQLVGHKRITTTERYLNLVDIPESDPNVMIEEL